MSNDGEVRIGTSIDTSGFEEGAKDLKGDMEELDDDLTERAEKTGSRLGNSLRMFADKFVDKLQVKLTRMYGAAGEFITLFGQFAFSIIKIGAKLGGIIGAMGVIFAIVSAVWILVRALGQADLKLDELKANFGYVGFVAAKIFDNLLRPAIDKTTQKLEGMSNKVNGLAGALYKVVVYIGYILSAWTGRNLFEGTGVDDYAQYMEKAQKSAKDTEKSTKQIAKDLEGFDEVNKLNDNTTAGAGGTSGGGITLPTLPNIGEVEIPNWVKWIAENKDTILRVCDALISLFVFKKTIEWLTPVANFFKLLSGSNGANIVKNLGLTGTQLGLIVGSIAILASSIHKIRKDIEETYELDKKIWERGNDELDEWLEGQHTAEEVSDRLNYKQKTHNDLVKDNASLLHGIVADHKEDLEREKKSLVQQDKLLQYKIKQWRQGELTKEQQKQLVLEIQRTAELVDDTANKYAGVGLEVDDLKQKSIDYKSIVQEITGEVQNTEKAFDKPIDKIDIFNTSLNKTKTSVEQIADGLTKVNNTKLNDKSFNINGTLKVDKVGNTALTIGNAIAEGIKKGIKTAFVGNTTKNFADFLLGNLNNIKLARGGIINNPGRGVALGTNIIGGEAGPEAVLPLDDRTMDRLGSSIAKHMVINTTMINQMNGRTISREVKKMMNENDFLYNS